MDNYEQQPEERVITNKQCDAWIKRIEKRWGPIRDKDGNELTTEEKRAMGRRDLAANPRRGPRPGSGKSKNKPGKDNLPVKTIPEAVAVPSDDSCIPLLVRAGYQDIVKSNTVFSAKQLTDIFYQNPCANTLKQLGKRLQTAEIVEYAIDHESPTTVKPILRFVSKRFLTPELCIVSKNNTKSLWTTGCCPSFQHKKLVSQQRWQLSQSLFWTKVCMTHRVLRGQYNTCWKIMLFVYGKTR